MATLTDSPFAVLTIIAAPAILTNACSVLCLGTGNRLARVVDRTRVLTVDAHRTEHTPEYKAAHARQLHRLKARARLILGALRSFYTSLGSFAAAALISVCGAVLESSGGAGVFRAVAAIALVVGAVGVGSLVLGCSFMVQETRLAVRTLEEEAALAERSI